MYGATWTERVTNSDPFSVGIVPQDRFAFGWVCVEYLAIFRRKFRRPRDRVTIG